MRVTEDSILAEGREGAQMRKCLDTKSIFLQHLGLWSFHLGLTFSTVSMRTPGRELRMILHLRNPFTRWLRRPFIIFIYSHLAADGGACVRVHTLLWYLALVLRPLPRSPLPPAPTLSRVSCLCQVTIPPRLSSHDGDGWTGSP